MLPDNFFKQHTRIAVDIDETLALTFWPAIEYAHSTGRLLAWKTFEDVVSHDFFADPQANMTKKEALRLWDEIWESETASPANAELVPYAVE